MSRLVSENRRIIIIDDNAAIHDDFRKILSADVGTEDLNDDEAFLFFGDAEPQQSNCVLPFELDSAFQGKHALELVTKALEEDRPYAMAFVDMRMPPGWDGVETIEHLWQVDPALQVVICTAYSDYSWKETIDRLGLSDQLLILKKPFDVSEVSQLAMALTEKWSMQQRIKHRMEELEDVVAERTQSLNEALIQTTESHEFLRNAIGSLSQRIAILDSEEKIEQVNRRWAQAESGHPIAGPRLIIDSDYVAACEAVGESIPAVRDLAVALRETLAGEREQFRGDYRCVSENSVSQSFSVHVTRFQIGESYRAVVAHEDTTELCTLQQQLVQAQKLESVGSLAAGVAHEINTPIQYIGDNTRFLQDSFSDLTDLMTLTNELLAVIKQNNTEPELVARAETTVATADVNYLLEEIPSAIDQSLEGIDRVTKIVRAMKEFAHPGVEGKQTVDLNHAIQSTMTVASNEWKYVAELETDFDPALPSVPCLPGEMNQVILNIVVNATHAIGDVVGDGSQAKGRIGIQTRLDGDFAEIRISDSGTGIPEEVQSRIFDPFFTTKEVGRGTGQGLALAWQIITEKHDGSLTFETASGQGTTFVIRLPLCDVAASELQPA